jgi:signal peptidase I
LPGDHVRIESDQLIINGTPVPMTLDGRFDDSCYHNMRLSTELLGAHRHHTLSCLTPGEIQISASASCDRDMHVNYQCTEPDLPVRDRNDSEELIVPVGSYLMIGDNRDNSSDGRVWGFVPDDHLVGKATRIWFNWDLHRSGGPKWSRIGHKIE